jgi:hypothetical protein
VIDPSRGCLSRARGTLQGPPGAGHDNFKPRAALAKLLSPFGIRTRTIWQRNRSAGSKSQRGYHKSQFERVWADYCDETNTPTQPSNIRRLKWP